MDNILVNLSLCSEEQLFSVALICRLVIYPMDSSFERLNIVALISFNKSLFLTKSIRYVTPFTGLNYLEIIPFTSAHANAYFVGDTPPPPSNKI